MIATPHCLLVMSSVCLANFNPDGGPEADDEAQEDILYSFKRACILGFGDSFTWTIPV